MHLKYLFYLILGTVIWGLSPIFYDLLSSVSSIEIVAHRSFWSAVFLILYIYLFSGVGHELFQKGRNEIFLLFLSGILIAINWYGFIYAVNSGNALQASLGYYIFPLVAVFLGIVFKKEKFTLIQILAICLVIASVVLLVSISGEMPGLALILAFSFGFYGLIKSNVKLDPTSIASGCSITNSVSSAELADLFIEVTNQQSGDAVANALVEVTTDLGTVLPSSGRALTDSFGVALLKIQPGNTGGAGTITVSALDEQISTNFAVGIADLILEVDNGLNVDSNGDVIPLKAGGSTIIEVTLKDEEGNLYTTPTDVEFSSTCVDNNNSSIDASVKSSSGIASSTYRANGCGIDDVVNITVETGGKNFTASTIIPVEVSAVQSIQFIDVSEPVIALPRRPLSSSASTDS